MISLVSSFCKEVSLGQGILLCMVWFGASWKRPESTTTTTSSPNHWLLWNCESSLLGWWTFTNFVTDSCSLFSINTNKNYNWVGVNPDGKPTLKCWHWFLYFLFLQQQDIIWIIAPTFYYICGLVVRVLSSEFWVQIPGGIDVKSLTTTYDFSFKLIIVCQTIFILANIILYYIYSNMSQIWGKCQMKEAGLAVL